MSKPFTPTQQKPAVLTANALRDGRCVWWTQDGWSADPRAATLFDDPACAEAALQQAEAQADLVVGSYLVEARRGPAGAEPVHFREAFRQRGPSVEPAAQQIAAQLSVASLQPSAASRGHHV
ncbi:DUF2849 domain-containing protein [uncultured Paracoccus sp.]|uniref:DUF2849 domain-containing protein n=1 Tax=uncultured Paracoccus sp. TaxID=189685 RepID=UPI002614E4AA|nr:DUF2849 domain-containing protein [uncultured Paracoccus sp.]